MVNPGPSRLRHRLRAIHERMGALRFMINGFADVVEKAGPAGELRVQPEFRSHYAAEIGDFPGVLQDVLGEAVRYFSLPMRRPISLCTLWTPRSKVALSPASLMDW